MLNKFLNLVDSLSPWNRPIGQAPDIKRFGKKLWVTVGAIVIIAVVLTAIFLLPSSEAEVISLEVQYFPGEKLIYDLTIDYFSQIGNSSTNSSSQRTLTVEVLSIDEDIYTLKYATISSVADNSTTTSYIMDVRKTDFVNLLTLLPVAFQQYHEYAEYVEKTNSTGPLEAAFFNQSEARVGDIWCIPVVCAISDTWVAELIVEFVAIENIVVKAGDFKVFKIEFTRTSDQEIQVEFDDLYCIEVSGQSYLEFGSCKLVQSTVQFNMTTALTVNGDYGSFVTTFSSTLIKDGNP
jgi:hypothetical protein